MLNDTEKDNLRKHLCRKYNNFTKKLTPTILKEYAEKSDEEIRAILTKEKEDAIIQIDNQIIGLQAKKEDLTS